MGLKPGAVFLLDCLSRHTSEISLHHTSKFPTRTSAACRPSPWQPRRLLSVSSFLLPRDDLRTFSRPPTASDPSTSVRDWSVHLSSPFSFSPPLTLFSSLSSSLPLFHLHFFLSPSYSRPFSFSSFPLFFFFPTPSLPPSLSHLHFFLSSLSSFLYTLFISFRFPPSLFLTCR